LKVFDFDHLEVHDFDGFIILWVTW